MSRDLHLLVGQVDAGHRHLGVAREAQAEAAPAASGPWGSTSESYEPVDELLRQLALPTNRMELAPAVAGLSVNSWAKCARMPWPDARLARTTTTRPFRSPCTTAALRA